MGIGKTLNYRTSHMNNYYFSGLAVSFFYSLFNFKHNQGGS